MNTHAMNARTVPRRLLLTLKLGEMPEHVPGLRAVRGFGTPEADYVDGGIIDRILRHHGGAIRAARLHSARVRRAERSNVIGARRFDDAEQLSGVARVLRIEVREVDRMQSLMAALAELPMVERVGADYLCHAPFDAPVIADGARRAGNAAWAHEAIRLPQALRLEPGDPAIVVGLADTGVAMRHAELDTRVRAGFDSVDLDPEAVGGLTLVGDFRHRGQRPDDDVGHGTGCAGILVARGAGMPSGGAGLCGLTPVRVLGAAVGADARRFGVGALDNIDAGMKRLVDLGVKVINMSFGTPDSLLAGDAPRPHEEVIRYALARGVILVAASGNSGLEERFHPAAHEGVIAVGAVDEALKPSSFSTRGEHVALCAPGRDIVTCGLDGYQRATGTSFAAPFVAAVCALMASRAQRRAWPLSGEDCKRLLIGSARPFARAGVTGCGHGVLDAAAALHALDDDIDLHLRDADTGAAWLEPSPAPVTA